MQRKRLIFAINSFVALVFLLQMTSCRCQDGACSASILSPASGLQESEKANVPAQPRSDSLTASDATTELGKLFMVTEGVASYYADFFHGRLTANGERFDMHDLTAAHKSLPFGSMVRVTNLSNGKKVLVRINDRGPYIKGRIIDLSLEAAKKINMQEKGITTVRLEVYEGDSSTSS